MHAFLLLFSHLSFVAALHAPPTVWRFPDENAEALRAAVTSAHLPDNLVQPAEIDTFLRGIKAPPDLGCFADSGTCADPERAILVTLGIAGRMEATANVEADKAHVLLVFTPAEAGAAERTARGDGPTLDVAVAAALADLQGMATLRIDAEPADVTLTLDDKPIGPGPGPYFITPGDHVVKATRADRVPGEVSIRVGPGDKSDVRFRLPQTITRIILDYTPADAVVKVDGQKFAEAPGEYPVASGKHVVRFTAKGFRPEERVAEIMAGTRETVRVELRSLEGSFTERLGTRSPDVGAHMFYGHGGLRTALLLDGKVGTGKGTREVQKTNESMELAGFDTGLSLRTHWLIADLGVSYLGGGDEVKAEVGGAVGSRVRSLSRFSVRPLVGAHLVAWRFEPYLMVGAAVTREAFEAHYGNLQLSGGKYFDASQWITAFASELGMRYQMGPHFLAGLAGAVELAPDQRTVVAFLVNAGYCFDPW